MYIYCVVCYCMIASPYYEIYSRSGPAMYIYCVVCYCVIVSPYLRSVGFVFAYCYILVDDSECPWTMID